MYDKITTDKEEDVAGAVDVPLMSWLVMEWRQGEVREKEGQGGKIVFSGGFYGCECS